MLINPQVYWFTVMISFNHCLPIQPSLRLKQNRPPNIIHNYKFQIKVVLYECFSEIRNTASFKPKVVIDYSAWIKYT